MTMRPFSAIIKNPLCIGAMLVRKFGLNILPDTTYLRLLYFFEQGKILRLKNPHDFTEKLQWLKLYDRNPRYTNMVDKVEAKHIAASRIGEEYIIPTLGIWKTFDDIDFEVLPNEFVLKSTNGSGGAVLICRDKTKLDKRNARTLLEGTSRSNVGITYREWPYRNIKPRYIAEELLKMPNESDLIDYKFFCFGGVPRYCQVITNRRTQETIDFYDMEWKHQEFYGLNPAVKPSGKELPKPENFGTMQEIASKLSQDIPFLRVDLYNIDGRIYFGETTFYPASGFGKFTPEYWNRRLGDMISLPK